MFSTSTDMREDGFRTAKGMIDEASDKIQRTIATSNTSFC